MSHAAGKREALAILNITRDSLLRVLDTDPSVLSGSLALSLCGQPPLSWISLNPSLDYKSGNVLLTMNLWTTPQRHLYFLGDFFLLIPHLSEWVYPPLYRWANWGTEHVIKLNQGRAVNPWHSQGIEPTSLGSLLPLNRQKIKKNSSSCIVLPISYKTRSQKHLLKIFLKLSGSCYLLVFQPVHPMSLTYTPSPYQLRLSRPHF